jgi:predicted MFS family arabinose efflux permease
LVLAMLSAGGIIGNFLTAAADFVSRRVLAGVGAAVCGACVLTFAFGSSFAPLAIAAFVWAAASDALVHGAQVALADVAGDDLAPTLARMNLLGSVGDVLAPLAVALATVSGLGWRPLFAATGVGFIAFGIWLGTQPLPPPPAAGPTPLRAVREVLADRRVWWCAGFLGLGIVLDAPFLGFVVELFAREGAGTTAAPAVIGAVVVGGTIGFLGCSMLRAPLRGDVALLVACVSEIVSVSSILFVPNVVVVCVGAFAFGAAGAVVWLVMQAMVLRLRPGQAGTTWAVVWTLALPNALVAPLVGTLADRVGLRAAIAVYALVPIAMLLLLLARPREDLRRSVE